MSANRIYIYSPEEYKENYDEILKIIDNDLDTLVIISSFTVITTKYHWANQERKLFKILGNGYTEVKLTKHEFKIINFLIQNANKIVTYEEIKTEVWGEKIMSIHTLRNFINKIRYKSEKDLIINHSGIGYMISPQSM